MNRYQNLAFVIASTSFGLLAAVPARAASVQMVADTVWGGNTGVPSYVTMYIYVPDQLAAKPPILVAHHSCGTPVSGYVNSITGIRAAADQNGFVLILPEATGRNCWDVGTMPSLTHDGGGDTHAIVKMVKYALEEYDGDPARVYAMGGSSGAMMTQALMAVYPDVFRAGSARAGVAAGCWADGFDPGQQWSNNCAGGNTTKSAQQWGDQARGMYSSYTGHRPRVQLFHGTSDTTINYRNMAESIKQWTNVLALDTMASATDSTTTPVSTYDRQYWENECGYRVFETWAGRNGTHSMAYEEAAILAFFGLDEEGGTDPEPNCPPDGGVGGTGGAGGGGAGGTGGIQMAGGAGIAAGIGGMVAGGGSGGLAGLGGTGGIAGSGGTSGLGGMQTGGMPTGGMPSGGGGAGAGLGGSGTGGGTAAGGMAGTGSPTGGKGGTGSGGLPTAGSGTAGSGTPGAGEEPEVEVGGCGCVVGEAKTKPAYAAFVALGLGLLAFRRRKRNTQRFTARSDS